MLRNDRNSSFHCRVNRYLIFYSPFDLFYKVCKFTPCKVVFACMKEVIRCKKVHDGVAHAAKVYPNGYLIMAIVGTVKGNGAAFLKIAERILRGVWTPEAVEVLRPTLYVFPVARLSFRSNFFSIPTARRKPVSQQH